MDVDRPETAALGAVSPPNLLNLALEYLTRDTLRNAQHGCALMASVVAEDPPSSPHTAK
jgi:hypothetical protein